MDESVTHENESVLESDKTEKLLMMEMFLYLFYAIRLQNRNYHQNVRIQMKMLLESISISIFQIQIDRKLVANMFLATNFFFWPTPSEIGQF
jgi:hypothetical protein